MEHNLFQRHVIVQSRDFIFVPVPIFLRDALRMALSLAGFILLAGHDAGRFSSVRRDRNISSPMRGLPRQIIWHSNEHFYEEHLLPPSLRRQALSTPYQHDRTCHCYYEAVSGCCHFGMQSNTLLFDAPDLRLFRGGYFCPMEAECHPPSSAAA